MVSFFKKIKERIKERFREIPQRLRDTFGGGGQEQPQTSRGGGTNRPFQTNKRTGEKEFIDPQGILDTAQSNNEKQRQFLENQISSGTTKTFKEGVLQKETPLDPVAISNLKNQLAELNRSGDLGQVSEIEGLAIQKREQQENQQIGEEGLTTKQQIGKGLVIGGAIGGTLAAGIILGPAAIGAATLSTLGRLGITGVSRSLTAPLTATRAGQNLLKLVRIGKISGKQARKIADSMNKLRINKIVEQLSTGQKLKKFAFGLGKIQGIAVLGTWYAADNMSSTASFRSSRIVDRVRFGQVGKEEGLAEIELLEGLSKTGRTFVVGSMMAAPVTAPLGFLILKGISADLQSIENDRKVIEGF